MKTKVARWGNSLALRIPSRLASSQRLTEGAEVEIVEEKGGLRLRAVQPARPKLEDLLSRITSENLHEAIEFDSPRGKESW